MDPWVIFIVNNVAMNVCMQLRRCINSFGYTPGEMELLAHISKCFFFLIFETVRLFSIASVLYSYQQCMRVCGYF